MSIGSKCGVADSMASTAVAGLAAGKHSTGWLGGSLAGWQAVWLGLRARLATLFCILLYVS